MPDLLLELFSEEIPARMQAKAADDLKKMVTDRLVDAGLVYEGARAFVTPRRLTLFVQGVPARQPDLKEERKGPRVGAPEGAIVRVATSGITAQNTTYGHRFMSPGPIKVRRFEDYAAALEKAKVVLDPARRREIILNDAKNLAFAQGYELVEDEGLLNEVAGLVEWPVVLMGAFDAAFLKIPGEVIRATIRNNQKCFVLRDPKSAKLANRFILTANIEAADGGRA